MREHRCFASRSHRPDNGKGPLPKQGAFTGGWTRHRSVDLSIFSRTLYQLSYPAVATLTGLEPATSAVTGRHANQLRYRAILNCCGVVQYYLLAHSRSDPNGIRTRAAAVKGRCPRPLNDRAASSASRYRWTSIRMPCPDAKSDPSEPVLPACRALVLPPPVFTHRGALAPILRCRWSSATIVVGPCPSSEGLHRAGTCCYCCVC